MSYGWFYEDTAFVTFRDSNVVVTVEVSGADLAPGGDRVLPLPQQQLEAVAQRIASGVFTALPR